MNRIFLLIAIVVAVGCVVVGLQKHQPRADFVFANRGDVFTLDPQRMSWLNDMQMAYCLYEGLVRWNPKDFSIELAVADEYQLKEDGVTHIFHIRDDARWNNGAAVTAHDFKYAWMRLLTPDTASDYSSFFFSIKGAREFWDWRTGVLQAQDVISLQALQDAFDELVSIKVTPNDDQELTVELTHHVPYFLDQLALAVCSPVYKPAVEGWELHEQEMLSMIEGGWHDSSHPAIEDRRWISQDVLTGRFNQKYFWARPEMLVCNGPFQLDTWRYKRDLLLTRNPYFHSPEMVELDTIQAVTISDPNTAVLAFEAGEIDWLNGVNVDYQADMLLEKQRGERDTIHAFPTFGTDFFSFNCRETLNDGSVNPFHNAAVRRAVVYATDRESIVQHATRLQEPVVTSIVPPNSLLHYKQVIGLNFDPKKGRAELACAGWVDRDGDGTVENELGEPFPPIDLLYTTNTPRYKWIALALRDQWKQYLGVDVNLRGTDNKFFSTDLRGGNFMIARGRWYGDYGDPTTFLDIFRSDNGNNDRGYVNVCIDESLDAASRETDPIKRLQMLREVERQLFTEEVPMLVICQLIQLYMYDPHEVRGLTSHPRLVQQLWRVH